MKVLLPRLLASVVCIILVSTVLRASEGQELHKVQPSTPLFLAARLAGDGTLEVRASESMKVEIVNAIRDAFGGGSDTPISVTVVPTIKRALFRGSEIQSQLFLGISGGALTLSPSSALDFGIVRDAASRFSTFKSIDSVYISGIGQFSAPITTPSNDPFGGGKGLPVDPFGDSTAENDR